MSIRCRIVEVLPSGETVIAAELKNTPVGSLRVKLVPFVYEMEIASSLQRRVADALLNYAQGYVRASGPREAFFVVAQDNEPMHRWLRENGAVLEDPSNLYMMEVR